MALLLFSCVLWSSDLWYRHLHMEKFFSILLELVKSKLFEKLMMFLIFDLSRSIKVH